MALLFVPLTLVGVLAATTPETTDFVCFWAGPHLILEGRDPYAQAEWNAVTGGQWTDALGRFRTGNCSDRFAYPYPLTTAVAMLPFGALPLDPAAALWELTIFIAAGLGLRLIARAAALDRVWTLWLAVLVLSSEMFYGNVLNAQFGGLTLFALGLLAAPRIGPARGTAGTLLAALKPHVIFLVPVVRLVSMTRPAIFTAAAFGALWFLASLALQPTWLAGWAADLSHRRELFNASTTLWTLESVMSVPGLALAVLVPALALLGLASWRAWPLAPIEVIAVAAIAWQLVVPYGLSYDQLGPIAVAAAAVLRIAAERSRSWSLVALLFVVMGFLPWVFFSRGKDMIGGRAGELEILNAFVPVAMCVLLGIALVIRARSGRTAA